ncbi:MAG TPA: AAA domain-containing protein, partial [Flavisolibacter sp.]|nr:AAA domain-containing protein [Flavisolibacter sp.]
AVHEGRNLVIQGPPGTGKSQTITNLIANAIGQGKKVLFVAEKMAALEVVKRRLDHIGLGEACLELHSHKANKKELHHELKRVLELGKPSLQRMQEEVAMLEKLKEEINAYSLAVNTPIRSSGLTVHNVYGYLLRIKEETGETVLPVIPLPHLESWDAQRQREAEAMAERIQARLKDIGMPSQLRFWGTGLRVLLPHEEEALKTALTDAATAIEKISNIAARVAQYLALPEPNKREQALKLATWSQALAAKPALDQLAVEHPSWLLEKDAVDESLISGKQLTDLKEKYESIFLPEAWQTDMLDARQSFREHGRKWYRFLIGEYKAANKKLKTVLQGEPPKDVETKIRYAEDILSAQRLQAKLDEQADLLSSLFGARYKKLKTDWDALATAADFLHDVHQQVANGSYPRELLAYLNRQEDPAIIKSLSEQLLSALNAQGKSIQALTEKLQLNETQRFPGGSFQHLLFHEQLQTVCDWQQNLSELQQAIAWNNLEDIAREADLECLTTASIDWPEA